MALSVTATVDAPTASVRLTITGGTPPYVVDAAPSGDIPDYRIRSTYSTVTGAPSTRLAVDGDVPLNTPTIYVATDATGAQAQSATVTVAHDGAVLSDATDPGRVLDVVVVSQPPNRWEARSVWWDVLGARAPFASTAPMRFRNGPLVFYVEGRTERAAFLDLVTTGNPLVLRTSTPDTVDDVVALLESLDEALVDPDVPSGPRLFTAQYQAIARELGPYAVDPGRTYAAVTSSYATYAAVLLVFPTYDALRVGDPNAGLGAELVVNGNFSSGSASWGTFWTAAGITWDYTGSTGKATQTAAGPGAAVTDNAGMAGLAVVPGTTYRVAGRVRSTRPGVSVKVELITNTLPATADYFQAGAAVTSAAIAASAAWSTFSVDVTVPAGDDTARMYFRADGMTSGDVVEWDDLSIRARV